MSITNDTVMPSDEELTVQEIKLSAPYMKAVAVHMHRACEDQIRDYMLKRKELQDPRKTLPDAAKVTACGIEFLQKLKRTCADETKRYADCIDYSLSGKLLVGHCRQPQRFLDMCVEKHFGLERPPMGYFSKLHVHGEAGANVVPPLLQYRDYKSEADKLLAELPPDFKLRQDYKRFREWKSNLWEK